VRRDLDQHVGLRDVDGVVADLGQEDRADLCGKGSVCLVLGSARPRRLLRDAAQAGALRFGRRGCCTCCAWARVRHQTREALGPKDAGSCVSLPASSTRSPTRKHSVAGARARAERSPHRASPESGARLGVALEGGQHARALLVRRAAVDEWLAQPLRVLAQRKDVVREHDDFVAAHLCARARAAACSTASAAQLQGRQRRAHPRGRVGALGESAGDGRPPALDWTTG